MPILYRRRADSVSLGGWTPWRLNQHASYDQQCFDLRGQGGEPRQISRSEQSRDGRQPISAVDLTFGEYLRAVMTVDYDASPQTDAAIESLSLRHFGGEGLIRATFEGFSTEILR